MVITSHSQPKPPAQLLSYLQQRVGLSDQALELGIRQANLEQAPLPIVLWSFGLISVSQFDELLNWDDK